MFQFWFWLLCNKGMKNVISSLNINKWPYDFFDQVALKAFQSCSAIFLIELLLKLFNLVMQMICFDWVALKAFQSCNASVLLLSTMCFPPCCCYLPMTWHLWLLWLHPKRSNESSAIQRISSSLLCLFSNIFFNFQIASLLFSLVFFLDNLFSSVLACLLLR